MFKWVISVLFLFAFCQLSAQNDTDSIAHKNLKEVNINRRSNGNRIDNLNPIRTEKLTQLELKKNACCNLAESFETNPTVEVSFTNAITGAKQIQMLGLSGTYVQLLTDLLPTIRGLNYAYGFSNIPSSQVNSIFINKGPGSVTNGFESMTGQIDVELQKPEISPKWFINAYINSRLRTELNTNYARTFSPKLSTMLMAHASTIQNKVDMNHDHYLDRPLYTQLNFINRWKYIGDKIESMWGIKALQDNKTGGNIHFDKNINPFSQPYYGFNINTTRWEAFSKTSYTFSDCGNKSIGLQLMYTHHNTNAFYGRDDYKGLQKTLYANIIYQTPLKENVINLRAGGGLLYDDIYENFRSNTFARKEPILGIFSEFSWTHNTTWSGIVGLRADYNSRLQKTYFTPRINLKYSPIEALSIRGSAGSGFRSANPLAENNQIMASNRKIYVLENLLPEHSWNYGLNISYTFLQKNKDNRLSVDLFRTDFVNQVIADFDVNPQNVYFYNLIGKSYGWYLQAEWYYEIIKNVDIRLAYKFNDVRITQHGYLVEKVLNAKHRALANIAYNTANKHWKFDFTTQWIGTQRLPNYSANPLEYQLPTYSPAFVKLLGQITYVYKNAELYIGSENINNFTQKDVVMDGEHPFGNYFDASNIWGPTLGRMFYVGFRYTRK